MAGKTAEVRVLTGPRGRPVSELLVDGKIGAAQLGAVVQKVCTNPDILKCGGLPPCPACKSGLDVNVIDHHQNVFQVEV